MIRKAEIERDIIATIVNEPGSINKFRFMLEPEYFSSPLHRSVFVAAVALADANIPASMEALVASADLSSSEHSQLSILAVEGRTLDEGLLSRKLAEEVLREKAIVLRSSLTKEPDVFDLLKAVDDFKTEADSILQKFVVRGKLQQLTDYSDYLLMNATNGVIRIPTGFPTLDRMLQGGLALGNLSLVGGLPGAGKTSFALCVALSAARQGFKTIFIEGEMSANEIYERLNGIEANCDIDKIRSGLAFDEWSRDSISRLFDIPLHIVVTSRRDPDSLSTLINYFAHQDAKLVVLDYLQVFAGHGKQAHDEYYQIKKISERLRSMSLRHGVHLLVLSSLNRNEQTSKKLTLNSFYGSSGLGHDCSVGMILSGKENDTVEMYRRMRNITLSVVKNRSGIRGDLNLLFHLDSQRMVELSPKPPSSATEVSR